MHVRRFEKAIPKQLYVELADRTRTNGWSRRRSRIAARMLSGGLCSRCSLSIRLRGFVTNSIDLLSRKPPGKTTAFATRARIAQQIPSILFYACHKDQPIARPTIL